MKKTFLLVTAIIAFTSIHFSAQSQILLDSARNHVYKHNLGFEVGQVTEFGLSYRYMPNKFGFQGNIGGNKDDYQSKFLIGETVLYSLFRNRFTDFYLFQGNTFKYEFDKGYNGYYDYTYGYYVYEPRETYGVNSSFGFGMELVLLNHISINGAVGYGALNNFEEIETVGSFGMYYKF